MCVHVTLDWTLERKLDRCQRIFHKSRFPLHKFSVCALQLVVCEVDNAYSFYEAAAVNLPPLAPGSASAMRETRRETHLVFSQRCDLFLGRITGKTVPTALLRFVLCRSRDLSGLAVRLVFDQALFVTYIPMAECCEHRCKAVRRMAKH